MRLGGRHIQGFMIDLEGVIHIEDQLIDKADEKLHELESKNIPHCFITNTTTKSRASLCQELKHMGLSIEPSRLITAPAVAATYLRQQGLPRCKLFLNPDTLNDFQDIPQVLDAPDYIVLGDIGNLWSYDLLNSIFRDLLRGAQLIALHKHKYWEKTEGLNLDLGAFVTALEYSSNKKAQVIGKPSATMFEAGLAMLGLAANEVAMVGDDIESDIAGAQSHDILGILVKTGKYREAQINKSNVIADMILESIANLTLA